MPIPDEVNQYERLMERLMSGYKARMFALCKAADLTPPQFFALASILRLKRSKMSPLADELGLSMGAASTLIDRLVSRGLVIRDADSQDRRAVYVSLSEKGHAVLNEAQHARREILTKVFTHLVPSSRAQLLLSLDALADAWDALGPIKDPGFPCGVEEA